jgi:hypothetical protein
MKSSRASCSARLLGGGDPATVSALLLSERALLVTTTSAAVPFGRRRLDADHAFASGLWAKGKPAPQTSPGPSLATGSAWKTRASPENAGFLGTDAIVSVRFSFAAALSRGGLRREPSRSGGSATGTVRTDATHQTDVGCGSSPRSVALAAACRGGHDSNPPRRTHALSWHLPG